MEISVIIPFYNEEENVFPLIERLIPVCKKYKAFEVICVDDGSNDKTYQNLLMAKKQYNQIKIIKFEKNAGQSDAFAAGFKEARFEFVVTLDADLQNPPEEIPLLLKHILDFDVVVGWRQKRNDNFSKKIASKIANKFRNMFLKDNVKDTGCSLKVFRNKVVKTFTLYKGMHRFFPALAKMHGFTVKEIPVSHEDRKFGLSKYKTFKRAIPASFDLVGVLWLRKRLLSYKIEKID